MIVGTIGNDDVPRRGGGMRLRRKEGRRDCKEMQIGEEEDREEERRKERDQREDQMREIEERMENGEGSEKEKIGRRRRREISMRNRAEPGSVRSPDVRACACGCPRIDVDDRW